MVDPTRPISLSFQLLALAIKGFVTLSTARDFGKDASVLRCLLSVEEHSLVVWAQKTGLASNELDPALNERLVENLLGQMSSLLTDSKLLKERYNLDIQPSDEDDVLGNSTAVASKGPNFGLLDNFTLLALREKILKRAGLMHDKTSFARKLRWAIIDKTNLEKLVQHLGTFNDRLAGLLGEVRQEALMNDIKLLHLQFISLNDKILELEEFKVAIKTIDGPASSITSSAEIKALRLSLGGEGNGKPIVPRGVLEGTSMELERAMKQLHLTSQEPGSQGRAVGTYKDIPVFIEYKPLSSDATGASEKRLKDLATLLSAHRASSFRSLHCIHAFEDPFKSRYCFLFESPKQAPPRLMPVSLLTLLEERNDISLTERLNLAISLANALLLLHSTGWVHKGIRSGNILFFSSADQVNILDPYITGYEYSRMVSEPKTSLKPLRDAASDIYRHPSALDDTKSFETRFDVYSFGLVLLEIALWNPLKSILDGLKKPIDLDTCTLNDIKEMRDSIAASIESGQLHSELGFYVGSIFTDAIKSCLSGRELEKGSSPSENLKIFFETVVKELEKCNV